MKKIIVPLFLGMLALTAARADTTLVLGAPAFCVSPPELPKPIVPLPTITSPFSLTGVSGSGVIHSEVPVSDDFSAGNYIAPLLYTYDYTIDLSGMSSPAGNHCVKLVVHFGAPLGCPSPSVLCDPGQFQSATLAPFGDITFVFKDGCLAPGKDAVSFSMISKAAYKTNIVTIIDDYVDPASGETKQARINVPALVPDIPPNPPPWVYYSPVTVPAAAFQGHLSHFPIVGSNDPPQLNGDYDLTLQLLALPTNGSAVSQVVTQSVQVVNGLFSVPLPGEPVSFADGSVRYLKLGIRPAGGGDFTPLDPPLPITPTPQAFYALSAGTVANLAPGQAVTSLNGLTDAVNLEAGTGIILGRNGNTLTISAQPGVPSDRTIKTDVTPIQPEDILARLAAMPIESWRYTNEVAGIRHVGPMAQDFRSAFGLGHGDKMIEFVDEEGVALAAIQGLNRKLEQKEAEIMELNRKVDQLTQLIQTRNNQPNGGEQ